MGKRVLYLVRHGQYETTTREGDEPDGPLTEVGREQAELTAERLSGLPLRAIHSSTLQRAMETARVIAARFPGVQVQQTDELRECVPAIPAGFEALFANIAAEEVERAKLQVARVFEAYFMEAAGEEERHEVLVSSGNLIRALVCRVLGAPADSWVHADMQLCGITEVKFVPTIGLVLVRHADTGHLPARLRMYV